MSKLSQETVNAFELVRDDTDLPTYSELIKFVRKQSKIIVKSEKVRPELVSSRVIRNNSKYTKTFVSNTGSWGRKNCIACYESVHFLKDCSVFKNISHDDRFKLIKDHNLQSQTSHFVA